MQPHLYDAQILPVIYLSGVLMFVAGLDIVRARNTCPIFRPARDASKRFTMQMVKVS